MWYKLHYYDPGFKKDHHFWFSAENPKQLALLMMGKNYDLNNFVSIHTEKKIVNANFTFKKYKGSNPAKLEGKNLKDSLLKYWDPKKLPELYVKIKKKPRSTKVSK